MLSGEAVNLTTRLEPTILIEDHEEMYLIQLNVIKFVSDFSPDLPFPPRLKMAATI
jgi:hypothetical protein